METIRSFEFSGLRFELGDLKGNEFPDVIFNIHPSHGISIRYTILNKDTGLKKSPINVS